MKQILWYLKGKIASDLKFNRESSTKIIGYSDSSHNIYQDDGIEIICSTSDPHRLLGAQKEHI